MNKNKVFNPFDEPDPEDVLKEDIVKEEILPEKTEKQSSIKRISWSELSDGHAVGKFIDANFKSKWIKMTTAELLDFADSADYDIELEDLIEFVSIPAVKKKQRDLTDKMMELNMQATLTEKMSSSPDIKDVKATKALLNTVEDDGKIYIYNHSPSSEIVAEFLEHECFNCGYKNYCSEFRK